MAKIKLSPLHTAFVQEYLANGFNGQQAYLKIKPNVTAKTANQQGYLLPNRPDIQEYIQDHQEKNHVKTISSRDYLITKANRIGETAEQTAKLDTALKSVDQVAKLAGIYTTEAQPMEGYADLLKTLVIVNGNVNVNAQQQTESQVIEVQPIDEA